MANRKRAAILISGRGSNMQALVSAAQRPDFPAEIVCVISNRPNAPGLPWARERGVETKIVDHKAFASRELFEDALQTELTAGKIDVVVLAGFMRLMTPAFVERWRDRMINIHPSLLPSFKGLHTHEQALAAGVRITGCTVHFVRAGMDEGPIIAQAAVPVLQGDTADTLAARVLAVEHQIYPACLEWVAAGRVSCKGEEVFYSEGVTAADPLYSPKI